MTELLKPPRQSALQIRNKDKLTDDVSDRLWSLYGQIAHLILERANIADLSEQRYYATFQGPTKPVTVSAQVDSLSLTEGVLTDWKFVTSYKFKHGRAADPEWTAQLNMQLEILRRNNLDAKTIQIVGLLRDWSKLEAGRDGEDGGYPKKGVVTAPIEIWERLQTVSFIEERVSLHEAARAVKEDSELPKCSDSERWAKPSIWAVMRGTRSIPGGNCFSERDALQKQRLNDGTRIEFRPGESIRCRSYCSVAEWCTQNPMKGKI